MVGEGSVLQVLLYVPELRGKDSVVGLNDVRDQHLQEGSQRGARMVLPNEEPVLSLIIGKTAGRIRKRAWSWKPEFTRTGNYSPIESEKQKIDQHAAAC